jgi:hypothetical protein
MTKTYVRNVKMSQLKLFYKAYEELKKDAWDGVGSYNIEEYFSEKFDIDLTLIDTEFEEGGRWYNWQTKTYQIGEEFYQLCEQVPATENQEGSEYGVEWARQVEPKQVIRIEYKPIKGESINLD